MSGRVVHFEIPFDDKERAHSFYSEVFGWNISEIPEMHYSIVTTGPTLLPEFLPLPAISAAGEETPALVAPPGATDWNSLADVLEEGLRTKQPELYRHLIQHFDALVLTAVMKAAGGFQSHAADLLGLSRPTLRAKLRTIARLQAERAEALERVK